MIEKIDTSMMAEDIGKSPMGLRYKVKRPLNNIETVCIEKINEIVDRFNEVFPL
jgi:hypothetical protein